MNSVRTSKVAAVSVVIVAAGRLGHFSFLTSGVPIATGGISFRGSRNVVIPWRILP